MTLQIDSLAKLQSPVVDRVVFRKRLFQTLDHARKKRTVWITGQPGSGKTTLVASYLSAHKLPHAWYHIDSSDTDLATFFYYLRHIYPVKNAKGLPNREKGSGSAKSARLPLLTPEYFLNIETYARRYFEILYSMLPAGFVLVFDNYHEINGNPLFHTIMQEALMRVPEYGNVIVISRGEPPDTFSRLRANSMMEIVRSESIRFTPEETGDLMRLRSGENYPHETAKKLHDLTDGWAAGIILVLGQDNARLDAASPGRFKNYQAIIDYFSAEIFDRLEPNIQNYLLRTSLFPSMTTGMAFKMTDNPSSERILSYLVNSHYFTFKHHDNTYRYHDLFREFLHMRIKEYFNETELNQIYQRAAMILNENGRIEDAIVLFQKAGDWENIKLSITTNAQTLLSQGRNILLVTWIRELPADMFEQDPWLLYWLGEASALFNPMEGRAYFEKAFKKFLGNGLNSDAIHPARNGLSIGIYLAWCGIIETFFYEFGNYRNTEKWIIVMEKIIASYRKFPSKEIEARVLSLMVQVLTFQKPMHPQLKLWAEHALSLLKYIKDPDMRIYYLSYITNYYSWTGNIVKFDMLIRLMKTIAKPEFLPIKTKLLYKLFMAVHARHLSSKEECLRSVNEALAIANQYGVHFFDPLIIAQAVYLLFGTGDTRKIDAFLSRMGEAISQSSLLDVIQYTSMLGWLEKLNGNTNRAVEMIEKSLTMVLEMGSPFPEALHRIALAELYYMQGDYTRADRYLRRSFFIGNKTKSYMIEYIASLLKASWLLDDNIFHNEKKGLKFLKKAMSLGRKYGIINTFLETRPVKTRMCMKALEQGIEVPYVQTLIKRLELIPDESPFHYENWSWPLKIFTMGGFKIYRDGVHIELSRKAQYKPMELLQFLVVHYEKGAEVDQVSSVLWREASFEDAHQTLDTNIHRLKKLLGSNDAVITQAGRVRLNPHKCWVDAAAFEYFVKSTEVLLDKNNVSAKHLEYNPAPSQEKKNGIPHRLVHGKYAQAAGLHTGDYQFHNQIKDMEGRIIALYKGDFFNQESLSSWAINYRNRLHDRFTHFLEKLGSYYEGAGYPGQAILVYKKGLEIDNSAELFYQRLMILYKSLGRYAEAVAVFKRCETILSRIFNLGASDKTKEIYQNIIK